MEEIKNAIQALRAKGWTLSAIADEIGVGRRTVDRWVKEDMSPSVPLAVLAVLRQLQRRQRVPKKRRVRS